MKHSRFLLLIFLFICPAFLQAQRVYPLVAGITIDSVMAVRQGVTKMDFDPVTGHLFYATDAGNIYEVFIPTTGAPTDSLRFSAVNHGITTLQGFCIRDSTFYLCGNSWSATTGIGMVVKGTLNANGTRTWISIATTDPYPDGGGDHGFTGICIDPAGNYMYVSSGSRTHLGEIRTNNNAWPGCREVPLTARIFRFPVNTTGVILPNDSTLIDNSGYVFAWGTRNAYDMAWDGNDTLFAVDNSGERDDPEELNWLREGKNYGFPWRMGGNYNPLMNSPYDVNQDPLVNHLSGGYIAGWFADVPGFPPVPAGVTFTDPVRNYGVAADFYRDSITGNVKNASDEGTYITSFTSHRSPLGLVFDRDSMIAAPFRGDGFILSFMPGGDSTGYTPLSPWGSPCPFVDPSRELVQMKLTYNAGIDNYTMTTANIVTGFYLPVDAELVGNVLYVIENGGGDLWRINFPPYLTVPEIPQYPGIVVYPNPAQNTVSFSFHCEVPGPAKITITDAQGKIVSVPFEQNIASGSQNITIDISALSKGIYFYSIMVNGVSSVGKITRAL
ncbi:hypothetical protein BH11BAC7_BH11BAC7_10010 [soil metagenome]